MRFWTVLFLLLPALAWAEKPGSTGSKKAPSKPSTQIYEKEDSESTFSAQVKVVREVQDETQVFFVDQKGFYVLNMTAPSAGSWQNLLNNSLSKKFKVSVTVNPDTRQILNVSRGDD